MKSYKAKIFLSIFLFFFNVVLAFSHPHLFFDSSQEFVWQENSLSGCWFEWTFDSYFSADIIQGYDYDFNGEFSEEETEAIFNNAFLNLKNYYYFIFIRDKKNRESPTKVLNFSAKIKNRKLVYRFFIDLSKYKNDEIFIAIYDYTFFCAIDSTKKNSTKLTYDSKKVSPKVEISENKDYPIFYNPLGAIDDTQIYTEWKSGLEIFYPKEIRIYYE